MTQAMPVLPGVWGCPGGDAPTRRTPKSVRTSASTPKTTAIDGRYSGEPSAASSSTSGVQATPVHARGGRQAKAKLPRGVTNPSRCGQPGTPPYLAQVAGRLVCVMYAFSRSTDVSGLRSAPPTITTCTSRAAPLCPSVVFVEMCRVWTYLAVPVGNSHMYVKVFRA